MTCAPRALLGTIQTETTSDPIAEYQRIHEEVTRIQTALRTRSNGGRPMPAPVNRL